MKLVSMETEDSGEWYLDFHIDDKFYFFIKNGNLSPAQTSYNFFIYSKCFVL